eukprot:jgi/Botrbrau1/8133/Bobra.0308s0025.1
MPSQPYQIITESAETGIWIFETLKSDFLNMASLKLGLSTRTVIVAFMYLAVQAAHAVDDRSARPSRKLLAATDALFQEYTQRFPGYSVMVCKNCNASNLNNVKVAGANEGGFQIWVFCSGTIVNNGDGGFDNWQFRGNFERTGDQGHIVNFNTC